MDALKVWGISTCVAVIIGSIVASITPSMGKQNIMRIVISAFVLNGLILPSFKLIQKSEISFDKFLSENTYAEMENYSEIEEQFLQDLEEACAVALYPIFCEELENLGINTQFGLKPFLSEEKEGIEIKKVNIIVSDLHMIDKDNILNQLREKTGLNIDIVALESGEMRKNE